MNRLTPAAVRRYRTLHALWFACVPVAFLGAALPAVLPPNSDWAVLAPGIWFFGFLIAGAVGTWSIKRRLVREVQPDPLTRQRIEGLSWVRPIGSFMAVNELLGLAERNEAVKSRSA